MLTITCSAFRSKRRLSHLASLPLALLLASDAGSQATAGAPLVRPGETHVFGPPDALGGSCDTPLFPPFSVCILDTAAAPGSPLSSFVVARDAKARATAEIHQTHDFTVDASWSVGTLLDAQVTGTIDVRGFLLMIGVGHAKVEVLVELLDVTDANAALVVACRSVSAHELAGQFSPGVGFGLDIEGGAPYIGGGASICASTGLSFQVERVRDSVDFALDATVRRGSAYRLVIRSSSEAEVSPAGLGVGGPGARAVASFFDPAALSDPDVLIPNLLDNYLGRLDDLVGLRLKLPTSGSFVNVKIFEEGAVPGLFNDLKLKAERQGDSVADVLQAFGVGSSNLRGMADEFFDLADARQGEDQIEAPGVSASRLCLTLRQDETERLDRLEIESALEQRATIVRHLLPAAHGGELERVFEIVEQRIAQSEAAGLVVVSAKLDFLQAQVSYAQGLYRNAHRNLIDAYRHLASGS